MRLGFTKKRVFPEPEPPITATFLLRPSSGRLGRESMVIFSVAVRRRLLSASSSTKGAISSGVPHRAEPYSRPGRYFFPLLACAASISSTTAAMAMTPASRSAGWKLKPGKAMERFPKVTESRLRTEPPCTWR